MTTVRSAAGARDALDLGLDLILTAEGALYQEGGVDEDQIRSVASTIEQGRKFLSATREWLDAENGRAVDQALSSPAGARR